MKNTTNKVLLILGSFVFAFIIAMTIIFCIKDSIPDTLVQCVLGGTGLECFVLAAIKISKVFKKEPEDTTDSEDFEEIE